MSLPSVTIIGTLTADPELRFVASGTAVASFTVAANERKRNSDGTWEDGAATFTRCSVWRQPAENLCESVGRGDRVFVQGRLKQRDFEDRDGNKRTVFELDVDEVGPTTKFATTKVNKVARSGGSGGTSGWGGDSGDTGGADDPWAPSGGGGAMDPADPPFAP